MNLQLLELLQNSSLVKKLLREAKKKFLDFFFSRTSEKVIFIFVIERLQVSCFIT